MNLWSTALGPVTVLLSLGNKTRKTAGVNPPSIHMPFRTSAGPPRRHWTVSKKDHPGSSADDIEQEPEWSSTNNEHYTCYKNRQGRRVGITNAGDESDDVEVRQALHDCQVTKHEAGKGRLVNFREVVESEKA